jgi:hypothetical protein
LREKLIHESQLRIIGYFRLVVLGTGNNVLLLVLESSTLLALSTLKLDS